MATTRNSRQEAPKASRQPRASRQAPEAAPVKRTKRAEAQEEVPAKRTKRTSAAEVVPARTKRSAPQEEVPTKRSKREAAPEAEEDAPFNPYSCIDSTLDSIEKSYGLTGMSVSDSEVRQHSSSLCLDLILAGGLLPGMYVFFGPEQSCKSTLATAVAGACIDSSVPICTYYDSEGSFSPGYFSSMLTTMGITAKDPLGVRDSHGKWVVPPRIRYYSSSVAETFFDYVAKLERELPDKVLIGDNWYLVYENTKLNQKFLKGNYDQSYLTRTGKLRVPAADGTLQALVICDSLPALLPERQDVDDPGSGMASQARMFSEQLKRVKGKMRSKRICFVAINQLRLAPMVLFGSPEYEPCGKAVSFFSDGRLRMYPRALSGVPGNPKGKGQMEPEPSVTMKGNDEYRYIHVKTHKNKLGGTPGQETWLRLWIKDPNGEAHGFDPVFDCWYYLKQTGQMVGKRTAMKLVLADKPLKRSINWNEFKILVVGDKKAQAIIWQSLGLEKAINLRKWCKNQLQNKDGLQRYYDTIKEGASAEKDDADDSED